MAPPLVSRAILRVVCFGHIRSRGIGVEWLLVTALIKFCADATSHVCVRCALPVVLATRSELPRDENCPRLK